VDEGTVARTSYDFGGTPKLCQSTGYNAMEPHNTVMKKTNLCERIAFSVHEVAHELGISPQLVRLEIRRAQLEATRVGKRIVVMRTALDRYLTARRVVG
jgi:excisionase family DNA binding protein